MRPISNRGHRPFRSSGCPGARWRWPVRNRCPRTCRPLLRVAAAFAVTVVPRGAGTGLSGGASVPDGALVLSTERLNRILRIDPDDEIAVVEPGVITAELDRAAAEARSDVRA